ncbi:MAG: TRIC cation channel family protein, partial [Proteobacteria bacterium]|nr:TRIC cation channel family protein [Pseudomonadota bacterium]
MTGVFGGMARAVLSGENPLVLRREIYATASLGGAIVFVLLAWLGRTDLAVFVSIPVTLGLRLAAIKWNLSLPHFISRSEYRNSDPE